MPHNLCISCLSSSKRFYLVVVWKVTQEQHWKRGLALFWVISKSRSGHDFLLVWFIGSPQATGCDQHSGGVPKSSWKVFTRHIFLFNNTFSSLYHNPSILPGQPPLLPIHHPVSSKICEMDFSFMPWFNRGSLPPPPSKSCSLSQGLFLWWGHTIKSNQNQ